jgi:hypothetical protein
MTRKAFEKIREGLQEALDVVTGSGNVFADLGIPLEAAETARPEIAEAIREAYARQS